MITRARHGMASATAVIMLALAGVTIAAMGSLFAAEARRTHDAAAEAQLRQLLIAGASVADQPVAKETKIELPEALKSEGGELVVRPSGAPDTNTRIIQVEARYGGREMSQSLRYVRREGRWQLAGATLGP